MGAGLRAGASSPAQRGHIQERADELFGPLAARLDTTMARWSPHVLEESEAFMAELNSTVDTHLAEQGTAGPEATPPPARGTGGGGTTRAGQDRSMPG
ncbi:MULTISPECIES: hypothetical protein [unclassified Streptomyces]|uniref:hypothetical protein n=1 Tax=unclassified Streptomyces TaxID=2593676 RepID=UPI001EF0A0C5|nr:MULTISPECIES: hypothetical protein [unclassified Streptomyces]